MIVCFEPLIAAVADLDNLDYNLNRRPSSKIYANLVIFYNQVLNQNCPGAGISLLWPFFISSNMTRMDHIIYQNDPRLDPSENEYENSHII